MKKKIIPAFLLMLPTIVIAEFPEFGFCPVGGPPGWFNRITGQHDRRYYYPPPPVYPLFAPNTWQAPVLVYPSPSIPARPVKK